MYNVNYMYVIAYVPERVIIYVAWCRYVLCVVGLLVLLLPEGSAVVGTILGVQANKGPPTCNDVKGNDSCFDETSSGSVVVVLRVVVEIVGEAPVSFVLALATFRFDVAAIIVLFRSLGVIWWEECSYENKETITEDTKLIY